ncbi:MAG TPA: TonB-dependent receptor plug domain-containing protein, partial [Steroidobacteraceae bacterium]|nr:TonB-dependent receptor plug domain-containing protein [Steroidobacteraceae bacterium]
MNAVRHGHARRYSTVAIAVAAVLGTAPLTTAVAQTRASATALEEITVTARKREESLIDVPVSVTAFTARALESLRIQNPDDIARYTPGFSYTQSFGRNSLERPVIRGMSNILGTPNASFFVDGVYINGPAVSTELSNLERVEVIKGPQAALYGRATFSGAVNYITRRPTNEFEGKLSATGAEHEEYEVNGFLSGPIVEDKFYYYIGGRYWQYGGEWENSVTGDEIGGQETQGGTIKFLWTPTENFEATLLATYSEDDDDHIPLVLQGREFNNCILPAEGFPRYRGYYCGEVL